MDALKMIAELRNALIDAYSELQAADDVGEYRNEKWGALIDAAQTYLNLNRKK